MHAAAAKGHARIVETLLKHGANADLRALCRALHALARLPARARALRPIAPALAFLAPAADFHQQLPLMYADFHGHAEVYKLLKEHKNKKLAPADGAKPAGDNRVCAECSIA